MAKFGKVALVGRSNVGKSTFLNAALGQALAIVSPLPQTTRHSLLGVVHCGPAHLAIIDTPGWHVPRSELGQLMNRQAQESLRDADVILWMTDVSAIPLRATDGRAAKQNRRWEADRDFLTLLPGDRPCVAVVNKVDELNRKPELLPYLEQLAGLRAFATILPCSVHDPKDVQRILEATLPLLPQDCSPYDEETLTDRPSRFFVAEFIREQVLLQTAHEVPHAVAVTIDTYHETDRSVWIAATLHVEKVSQRKILVGRGGSRLRAIGIGARKRIETLLSTHVRLDLVVRVTPRWKHVPRMLADLGFDSATRCAQPNPKDGMS